MDAFFLCELRFELCEYSKQTFFTTRINMEYIQLVSSSVNKLLTYETYKFLVTINDYIFVSNISL